MLSKKCAVLNGPTCWAIPVWATLKITTKKSTALRAYAPGAAMVDSLTDPTAYEPPTVAVVK